MWESLFSLKGVNSCYFLFSVVASLEGPEHVHISLGDDASMIVVWSSRDNVDGVLEYGVSSEKLSFSVPSTVALLPVEYIKANRYIHRSEMKVKSLGVMWGSRRSF